VKRKIPENKIIDERIRIRLESSEEGEHVPQERPTQMTRWERVLHVSSQP